eukprot:scaffold95984_cov36-Cyclotella_meneghiniana.AAC.2
MATTSPFTKVDYPNAFRSDIRHNISDVTTKRDSLIWLSSPARHGHCCLVLPNRNDTSPPIDQLLI